MTKTETIDRTNREIEIQNQIQEARLTDLELSLDEQSYVSGGWIPPHFPPGKVYYCGQA